MTRTHWALLALVALSGFACKASTPAVTPEEPSGSGGLPGAAAFEGDRGVLTGLVLPAWDVEFDGTDATITPVRTATAIGDSFVVNATHFFTVAPDPNALTIAGIRQDAQGRPIIDWAIHHPFGSVAQGATRADLDVFDMQLVLQPLNQTARTFAGADRPAYADLVADATSYTPDLEPITGDSGALPCVLVDTGQANNRLSQGSGDVIVSTTLAVESGQVVRLRAYTKGKWGISTLASTRLTPLYFLPEFNQKSAWKVHVTDVSTVPLETGSAGSLAIQVRVFDWNDARTGAATDPGYPNPSNPAGMRASSDVVDVRCWAPDLSLGTITVTTPIFGTGEPTNPLLYDITIPTGSAPIAGEYPLLLKVTDSRSPGLNFGGLGDGLDVPGGVPGFYDLTEFASYQVFYYPVATTNAAPTVNVNITTPVIGDGGTLSIAATGYSDPELDPITLLIDWTEDGDFGDAGESQVLTTGGPDPSPFSSGAITYSYVGPGTDIRTLDVRYTDGFRLPVAIPGLDFEVTPAINLPPAVSFQVVPSQVPSGQTYVVRASGISDPEGNPITVEVDWNNLSTWTPAGTITFPYPATQDFTAPATVTFTGPAPDMRNLPVRYSDGNSTITVTPTMTFEVITGSAPTCNAPPADAGALGTWAAGSDTIGTWASLLPAGTAPTIDPNDIGAMQGASPRGFVIQNYDATAPAEYDFYRLPVSLGAGSAVRMSNTGTALAGKLVHQIEVDATHRVVFAWRTNLTNEGNPIEVYSGAASAIGWFDYDGVTPAASFTTVPTSAGVIAMTLDELGNLIYLDANNVLHRLLKGGGYAEEASAMYPRDLKAAPYNLLLNGGPLLDHKCHDLVYSYHNQGLYLLMQRVVPDTATRDGMLVRIDCNGGLVDYGYTNPRLEYINQEVAPTSTADIFLDQWDASGNPFMLSDGQLAVVAKGNPTSPSAFTYLVFRTRLSLNMLASGSAGAGRLAIVDNVALMRENANLPSGWRSRPWGGI